MSLEELLAARKREAERAEAVKQEALQRHRDSLLAMMSKLSLEDSGKPKTVPEVNRSSAAAASNSMRTSELTVISHTHGRQRREERDIAKRELQEAIKYGRRERANPGRDGSRRWRFTHKSVIYITDETMRHEITSWRMQEAGAEEAEAVGTDAETGSHTVLVVDSSGSMRKNDVPGYTSRTAAVYDCLARDFVEPQLAAIRSDGCNNSKDVVTLVEMGETARLIFYRHPLNEDLRASLKARAGSRARSHGNYLPALDAVLALLRKDAQHGRQLFLLFLSDGAPSDQVGLACAEHGVLVWQEAPGRARYKGKAALNTCPGGFRCRAQVKEWLLEQCLERVTRLGDLFGRDRTFVGTVAFGPPDEDYQVLQQMAARLPRGSFQKLGLTALHLRTALSSLSNSLSSLRSDAGAGALTQRAVRMESEGRRGTNGWDVYRRYVASYLWRGRLSIALHAEPCTPRPEERDRRVGANRRSADPVSTAESKPSAQWPRRSTGAAISKQRYDVAARGFVDAAYEEGSDGVAHSVNIFAHGAERAVYHCTEIDPAGRMLGPRLVAKQTRFEELMRAADFHSTFCRVQVRTGRGARGRRKQERARARANERERERERERARERERERERERDGWERSMQTYCEGY